MLLLCWSSLTGPVRARWFASRCFREIRNRDMCEFFLTAGCGSGQRLQQWILFALGYVLGVTSKEIGYVGYPNAIRRRDEPKTASGATTGFDKTGPRHQVEDLGRLCGRETGGGGDLVSLKRFGPHSPSSIEF